MPLRPKLIKLAKLHLWWCTMERNQIPWIAFDTKSIVTQVDPKSLPPTSAAAKFSSWRVFLQVNQWKDPQCYLLAEEWGWVLKDTGLHPVLTDMPPAPAELLKIIRCNCTTDCGTARCTCKNMEWNAQWLAGIVVAPHVQMQMRLKKMKITATEKKTIMKWIMINVLTSFYSFLSLFQ